MLYTKVIRGRNVAQLKQTPAGWTVICLTHINEGASPSEFLEYSQFCQDVANILGALQSSKSN